MFGPRKQLMLRDSCRLEFELSGAIPGAIETTSFLVVKLLRAHDGCLGIGGR